MQGTLPSYASLDSGVNEYLVGQSMDIVDSMISLDRDSIVCE